MKIITAYIQWEEQAKGHLVQVDDESQAPLKDSAECGERIPYGEVWRATGDLTCPVCRRIAKERGMEVR